MKLIGSFSYVGQRHRLEDSCYISPDHRLLVICDGVGGNQGGDVAADLVIQSISEEYEKIPKASIVAAIDFHIDYMLNIAVRKLISFGRGKPHLQGMATTLVLSYIDPHNRCWIVHCGDSRAYVIRDNSILWRTRDDTVLQDLWDAGIITKEEELLTHPYRNQITQQLYCSAALYEPTYHLHTLQAHRGDLLLMGSDGAFENYTDTDLCNHFANEDLTLLSRWEYFDSHCKDHSQDNSTAILLRI